MCRARCLSASQGRQGAVARDHSLWGEALTWGLEAPLFVVLAARFRHAVDWCARRRIVQGSVQSVAGRSGMPASSGDAALGWRDARLQRGPHCSSCPDRWSAPAPRQRGAARAHGRCGARSPRASSSCAASSARRCAASPGSPCPRSVRPSALRCPPSRRGRCWAARGPQRNRRRVGRRHQLRRHRRHHRQSRSRHCRPEAGTRRPRRPQAS